MLGTALRQAQGERGYGVNPGSHFVGVPNLPSSPPRSHRWHDAGVTRRLAEIAVEAVHQGSTGGWQIQSGAVMPRTESAVGAGGTASAWIFDGWRFSIGHGRNSQP